MNREIDVRILEGFGTKFPGVYSASGFSSAETLEGPGCVFSLLQRICSSECGRAERASAYNRCLLMRDEDKQPEPRRQKKTNSTEQSADNRNATESHSSVPSFHDAQPVS
jgi:hypothetical protein